MKRIKRAIAKLFTAATFATAALIGVAATGPASEAATLDLTTAGASGTLNGATFTQVSPQPTGTGVFDPFVRLQANESEQGYNTDNTTFQFDEKAGIWTHSITLAQVGLVTLSGTSYREFSLDINEPNNGDASKLTLDRMQIFLSGSKTNTYPNLGTKVFDLDDNQVELDASLSHGSGSGDMYVLVPESDFLGHSGSEYLYLYSHFSKSAGGFEEWATTPTTTPPNSVPEPASATVILGGLGALGLMRPRRKTAAAAA
jgi:hypothetical protein